MRVAICCWHNRSRQVGLLSGTTLTIKGVSAELVKDPIGRIYCHRHPEHGWLPGGASNTGGEILAQCFPDTDLATRDTRATGLVPTSLLVYPLVGHGERFPFVAPDAEGFIAGKPDLLLSNSDLIYGASLEGVALLERLATALPLVSSDFRGDSRSCIVDGLMTTELCEEHMIHVAGWYDNEWGYASRVADLAIFIVSVSA